MAAGSYSLEFDLCTAWVECFYRSNEGLSFNVTGRTPFASTRDFRQEWGHGTVPLRGAINTDVGSST